MRVDEVFGGDESAHDVKLSEGLFLSAKIDFHFVDIRCECNR